MWRRVHRIYRPIDVIAVRQKKDKLRNENYLLSNANYLGNDHVSALQQLKHRKSINLFFCHPCRIRLTKSREPTCTYPLLN